MIPMLVVTPLTFLGGSFYSVNMLPSGWRTITLLNPVVYLISRLPLELLRDRRRQRRLEPRHDAGLPGRLHDRGVVDLQDRLPAEELTRADSLPGRSTGTWRSRNGRRAQSTSDNTEMVVTVVVAAAAIASDERCRTRHPPRPWRRRRRHRPRRRPRHPPGRRYGCLHAEPSCAPRDDALRVSGMGDREQRENDGGSGESRLEGRPAAARAVLILLFILFIWIPYAQPRRPIEPGIGNAEVGQKVARVVTNSRPAGRRSRKVTGRAGSAAPPPCLRPRCTLTMGCGPLEPKAEFRAYWMPGTVSGAA